MYIRFSLHYIIEKGVKLISDLSNSEKRKIPFVSPFCDYKSSAAKKLEKDMNAVVEKDLVITHNTA